MSSSKSSRLGKKTHKIILLGESGVGKTCIIQKFASNRFDDHYNPTIGVDFVSKDIKFKGVSCRLQLWDTAGQQKFKSLVPTYLKDAVCCVFVFDINKPETLERLERWMTLFRDIKKERAVSLICGNKDDLQKKVDKQPLEKLIDKYKMPYYCVSAKTSHNIEELFYKVAEMLDQQYRERRSKVKASYTDEYEHPPNTVESLTRSQTKHSTLEEREEGEKETEKLIKTKGWQWCSCCPFLLS